MLVGNLRRSQRVSLPKPHLVKDIAIELFWNFSRGMSIELPGLDMLTAIQIRIFPGRFLPTISIHGFRPDE